MNHGIFERNPCSTNLPRHAVLTAPAAELFKTCVRLPHFLPPNNWKSLPCWFIKVWLLRWVWEACRYSWVGIQWDRLSLLSISFTYRRLSYKEKRVFTSATVLTEDSVCLLNCLPVRPVQEAEKAIQCLNGKLALSKKLVVRWAHAQVKVSLLL